MTEVTFDIGPSYEFIEKLGLGSYGAVCKAQNKLNSKFYAIKKYLRLFDSYIITKRTLREIKILKHLCHHENVIGIEEAIISEDNNLIDIYLVLDFMESDLHNVIYSNVLTEEHIK